MKEEFVTYELAVKLKKKGFNDECHAYYEPLKHCLNLSRVFKTNSLAENYNCIAAPTVSQVLKWLREKKGLYVDISLYKKGYCTLIYETNFPDDKDYANSWRVNNTDNTYEEAAIAGIEYVVDNLI